MALGRDELQAERDAAELLAIYREAQRTIAAQVQRAISTGDIALTARRRAQLAAVIATLERLGAETDPKAVALVADAYQEGAARTLTQINKLQIGRPEASTFAGVSQQAVTTLQDAILGRLTDSRRTVGRTVDDVYARAQRRVALHSMLGAEGSPRSAQRRLTQELLKDRDVLRMVRDGGFGFVDRSGKRWALHTYAEMATRTVIREAAVQGSLNRMAAHGINLARVSVHANPCPVCAPWQGRLVSLDGSRKGFEGEAVYTLGDLPSGGPPMHPRCKHSLQPVAVRVEATRRQLQAEGVI